MPPTKVTITHHTLEVDGNLVTIASEQLWTGAPRNLPASHAEFRPAVDAARNKATCYHCRDVHFRA